MVDLGEARGEAVMDDDANPVNSLLVLASVVYFSSDHVFRLPKVHSG